MFGTCLTVETEMGMSGQKGEMHRPPVEVAVKGGQSPSSVSGSRDRIGFGVVGLPDLFPVIGLKVGQAAWRNGWTHVETGQGLNPETCWPGGHKDPASVFSKFCPLTVQVSDNLKSEEILEGLRIAPPAQYTLSHSGGEDIIDHQPSPVVAGRTGKTGRSQIAHRSGCTFPLT